MISRLFIPRNATRVALFYGAALAALAAPHLAQAGGTTRAAPGALLHVEVGLDTGLRLEWAPSDGGAPRLRLAGGTPGRAGALTVESLALADGTRLPRPVLFTGRFGADGALVVELPATSAAVRARGLELDGGVTTSRTELVAAPAEASAFAVDVHRAVVALGQDERVQLHLLGSARLGTLQAWVDTRLEVRREGEALVLAGAAGVAELSFASEAELVRGLEAVTLLQTFASLEGELVGGGTLEKLVTPGAATPIPGDPLEGGKKKPAIPGKKQTKPFDGPLPDGGLVEVELPTLDTTVVTGTDTLGALDEPDRAGNKRPPIPGKKQAKPSDGPLLDGGVVEVVPPTTTVVTNTDTLGALDEPDRAGDKRPPIPGKKQAKPFDGPLLDGGVVGVELPTLDTTVVTGTDTLGALDEPDRAGNKRPPIAGKGQALPSGPVVDTAPPRSVLLLSSSLQQRHALGERAAASRALQLLREDLARFAR